MLILFVKETGVVSQADRMAYTGSLGFADINYVNTQWLDMFQVLLKQAGNQGLDRNEFTRPIVRYADQNPQRTGSKKRLCYYAQL